MKVALYARVSTQRQAQTQNVDQQLEQLQAHVQAQGWSVACGDIFRDDGYSGATLKRPGLDKGKVAKLRQSATRSLKHLMNKEPSKKTRKIATCPKMMLGLPTKSTTESAFEAFLTSELARK